MLFRLMTEKLMTGYAEELTFFQMTAKWKGENHASRWRFGAKPEPEPASLGWSLVALASLLWMGFKTNQFADQLKQLNAAKGYWMVIPFHFLSLGAIFGFLLESYLIAHGQPFRFAYHRFISQLNDARGAVRALVLTSSTFLVLCLVTEYPERSLPWALPATFLLSGGLSVVALFRSEPTWFRFVGTMLLIVQITLPALFGVASATFHASWCLVASGCTQLLSTILNGKTPRLSSVSRCLTVLANYFLYSALCLVSQNDQDFVSRVADVLSPTYLTMAMCLLSFLIGLVLTLRNSTPTYQAWRTAWSLILWTVLFANLVGRPLLVFNPERVSHAYGGRPPRIVELLPYSLQHPKFMAGHILIPSFAGDQLPEYVEVFKGVLNEIRQGFKVFTTLGHYFPTADRTIPLKDKVRHSHFYDARDLYPSWFFRLWSKVLDFPMEGISLLPVPQSMKDAKTEGLLLAHLCQYKHSHTMLKLARETEEYPFFELIDADSKPNQDDRLVLDLRHLEGYDFKEDYEPYGGCVLFKIRSREECQKEPGDFLDIVWLMAPKSKHRLRKDPRDERYRRAEYMIFASITFAGVTGKHLAEIHFGYNLLPAALQNCFDCRLNPVGGEFNGHPLRIALHLHTYAHPLATEETVCHLVNEMAVFGQIWSMTYDSLCKYLSDTYNWMQYASDEDFDYRKRCWWPLLQEGEGVGDGIKSITVARGSKFTCSLHWELEYFAIFLKYSKSLVYSWYEDDAQVEADETLPGFWATLVHYFPGGLPDRYKELKTRDGIVRFLADTIHHICIRHQIYGTNAVTGACDTRFFMSQVPKDGGPPAVDEWRSLAFVTLATAYAFFPKLLQDPANIHDQAEERPLCDHFDDVSPRRSNQTKRELVRDCKKAFQQFQIDLRQLQGRMEQPKGTPPYHPTRDTNFNYGIPEPIKIRLASGY